MIKDTEFFLLKKEHKSIMNEKWQQYMEYASQDGEVAQAGEPEAGTQNPKDGGNKSKVETTANGKRKVKREATSPVPAPTPKPKKKPKRSSHVVEEGALPLMKIQRSN